MSADEVRPAGSCKHRPVSNGWTSGTRDGVKIAPYSWCGYCKAYVEHDAEWAAKFASLFGVLTA